MRNQILLSLIFFVGLCSSDAFARTFEETFNIYLVPRYSCHYPSVNLYMKHQNKIRRSEKLDLSTYSVNGVTIDSSDSAERVLTPFVRLALDSMEMSQEDIKVRESRVSDIKDRWEREELRYSQTRVLFDRDYSPQPRGVNEILYLVDGGDLRVLKASFFAGRYGRPSDVFLRFKITDLISYASGRESIDFNKTLTDILISQVWRDANGTKLEMHAEDFGISTGPNAPKGFKNDRMVCK